MKNKCLYTTFHQINNERVKHDHVDCKTHLIRVLKDLHSSVIKQSITDKEVNFQNKIAKANSFKVKH